MKVLHSSNKRSQPAQAYDAAHIASAERGRADVFLSTHDRLIKRAKRNSQLIHVPVDTPAPWLIQTTHTEDKAHD